MAGIGFALKRLSDQDTLASKSIAAGHAILISSGPWVVIMGGLGLLSGLTAPYLGADQTKILNVIVMYGFALSLVITWWVQKGANGSRTNS